MLHLLSIRLLAVNLLLIILLSITTPSFAQNKLYVVERERENVAIIDKDYNVTEVKGLGNLNHATIKFNDGFAYILSRDGFLSKFTSKALIKKAVIGKSGIGFTFIGDYIVVANYEPYSLVILDKDLEQIKSIATESRNVGIKALNNLLVFSLMDKNAIWVLDLNQDFKVIKKIDNVGKMPFDALIDKDKYTVAFFDGSIGLLDLKSLVYKNIPLEIGGEVVLKIPHLGTWCSLNERTYIPGVGKRKIHVLKEFSHLKDIDVIGIPVFTIVSPDNIHIAVNYSGDKQNYVSIINTNTGKITDIKAGDRIMHLRFSADGKKLYLSSFYENQVKVIETIGWTIERTIDVATPSGIFIGN